MLILGELRCGRNEILVNLKRSRNRIFRHKKIKKIQNQNYYRNFQNCIKNNFQKAQTIIQNLNRKKYQKSLLKWIKIRFKRIYNLFSEALSKKNEYIEKFNSKTFSLFNFAKDISEIKGILKIRHNPYKYIELAKSQMIFQNKSLQLKLTDLQAKNLNCKDKLDGIKICNIDVNLIL